MIIRPEKVGFETSLKVKGNNDLQSSIMVITRRCEVLTMPETHSGGIVRDADQ